MALSLVLLTGAGLMIRTFAALQQTDLGFNPSNILVARLPFPHGQYKTAAEKQRFFSQLLPRVKQLPGVVDATETSDLPPYGGIGSDIEIPGKVHTDRWEAIFQLVSEGYFHTLRPAGAWAIDRRKRSCRRAQAGRGEPDAGYEVFRTRKPDRPPDSD